MRTLVLCIAAEDGTNLQSWLLCVEMLPSAIFMIFAFPWSEYVVAGGNIRGGNITHAISIRCASACAPCSRPLVCAACFAVCLVAWAVGHVACFQKLHHLAQPSAMLHSYTLTISISMAVARAATLSPTRCISSRLLTTTTCSIRMARGSKSRRPKQCAHALSLQVKRC